MNPQDAHFNPFPGLRPFQIEEKFLFFGREEQTAELLTRLRKTRFLAVVGVSGSGKSSLVRAGLLPELHGGTMATAGSSWEVAVMRPGGDPLTNLAEALIEADIHDADEEHVTSHVRTSLARSGMGLVDAIKQGDLPENTNLLLVVDQFEEIFRFRRMSGLSEEEAGHFITLLLEASEQIDLPIYVVLTMRSDFLGDCAQFRGLAESVNEGEYLIPRLNRNQRRQAIEGPVAVGQREISSRLVQRLLNDIGDDPDQLPILQHALMRTWDHWDESGADGPLDLDHYQATGGMDEALSRHADEVHAELPDDEHRWIAEKLFKALTEKVDHNRGIRRPMQFRELCEIIEKDEDKIRTVVDAFRRQGRTFLMPSGEDDITKKTVIDISHESLMRAWRRLRDWVDDEAQSAKIYRRLADTSSLYQEGKAGYYRDPDLQIALSWRDETKPNKTWADHYFAGFEEAMVFLDQSHEEAGREEREREEARQRELAQAQALAKAQQERAETEKLRAEEQTRSASRLRKMLAGLAMATCAAIVFLVIAVIAKQATEEAKREVDNKILELAERSIARGDELSDQGETLEALPWYADAASLAKGNPERQQAYKTKLIQKIEQAPRLVDVIFRENSISYFRYSPDGSRYFVAESAGAYAPSDISFYESSTGRLLHKEALPGRMRSAKFSHDGKFLYTHSGEGTVKVWDVAKAKALHTFDKHGGWVGNKLGDSLDNSLLAVPVRGFNTGVIVWDLNSGNKRFPLLATDHHCHSAAISRDGRYLAGTTGNWGFENFGAIYVWALMPDQHPKLIYQIDIGTPVHWVDFSPMNDSFVIGCGNFDNDDGPYYAQVFDAKTGQPTTERIGHISAVKQAKFSPDGRWILTGSVDGTAQTWDARTGASVSAPMVHEGELNNVDFSPDGALVTTASADKTARVWNAQTGEPVTPPLLHVGIVNDASFDYMSRTLTTSGSGGTARQYQLPIEQERLFGKATQSTTGYGGVASRANDGNTDGNYWDYTVTHTANGDPDPWWQLELTEQSKVSKITLWNRTDGSYLFRLVNFRVRLLSETNELLWTKDFLTDQGAVGPNPKLDITLPELPTVVKIRIEKIGSDFRGGNTLSLAEVEVFKATQSYWEDQPLTKLEQFTHVASSGSIDTEGRLNDLSKNNLKTTWESLDISDYKKTNADESAAWHRTRAERLDQANQWSGFFYHHSRLEEDDRQTPKFIAMEAGAHAAIGNLEEAIELHLKSEELSPEDLSTVKGSLTLCAHQGRFDEGQKIFNRAIKTFESNQDALGNLALEAILNPKLAQDISIPVDWIDTQYEQRSGYIDLGDSEALRLTKAITIEGWFWSKSGGALTSKGGAFMDDGYGITVWNNTFRFELQNTDTKEKIITDAPIPDDKEWIHLAATWDNKTREVILYIDGVRQDQIGFFNGPIGISDQHLNLGRNERWSYRNCSLASSEFRVWDRARTGNEIQATMNERLKGDEPGLVGYWPFNEKAGTIVKSGLITEGIDGTIVNPIWGTTDALPFSDETPFCEVRVSEFIQRQTLTLQGGLLYRNGNNKKAVDTLESARIGGTRRPQHMLSPDDGSFLQWLLLAQCYYKLGDEKKASTIFKLANERMTNEALREIDWAMRLKLKMLQDETRKMLGD